MLLAAGCWLLAPGAFSQDIKRSNRTEVISGQKYYLHEVQKKQTLYSIAKAYEVKVDDILKANPEAADGIRAGMTLKIPSGEKVTGTKEIVKKNPVDSVKKIVVDSFPLKNEYRIALFLPFYLGGMDLIEPEKIARGSQNFPEKSKIAIEFYRGALFAADSLRKQGMNVSLHMYDTGVDSAGMASLLKKPELKEMDLFIGPLYLAEFTQVARLAKQYRISIVSPLATGNKILLSNTFVSKVTPSVSTQTEEEALYIARKFPKENLILLTNSNPKDAQQQKMLKAKLNEELLKQKADTVKVAKTLKQVSDTLTRDKLNILMIPCSAPAYVTDILTRVYNMKEDTKDSIIVFGMEAWNGFESLDFQYLSGLNVHLPSHSLIDYSTDRIKGIVRKYREEMKADPGEYYFSGFDVTYFYMTALKAYGRNFQKKLDAVKWSGFHTGFDMYSTGIDSGWENRSVHILHYNNSRLEKVN